jgi:hypothetical protein
VSGQRIQLPIHWEPTPSVGDTILVSIGNGSTPARVTGVRKYQSKSPETVETVDDVDSGMVSGLFVAQSFLDLLRGFAAHLQMERRGNHMLGTVTFYNITDGFC